jgi:hypothetical protein
VNKINLDFNVKSYGTCSNLCALKTEVLIELLPRRSQKLNKLVINRIEAGVQRITTGNTTIIDNPINILCMHSIEVFDDKERGIYNYHYALKG